MKPTLAPIHLREPRPIRYCAGVSSVRSDKWPSRTVLPKSRSIRSRYKPSGRRCKDANCASVRPRAVARRNRNRRSRAIRHRDRAWCRKYCRKQSDDRWNFPAPGLRSKDADLATMSRRSPFRPTFFLAHSGRLGAARAVLFPAPDARHRDAVALGGRSRPDVRRRSAVFDTNKKSTMRS